MSKSEEILTRLSERLKETRRAKGLSLDAVAKLSGVSRSMVSQIERGASSPTVATLWNLTRALQVDFAGLLDPEEQSHTIEVMTAGETPTMAQADAGVRIRILSPPEDAGEYEVYELIFEPDGILDSQPHAKGVFEQLTVICGTLVVTSGADTRALSAGDTARYAADCLHQIKAGDRAAQGFLIVRGQK